MLNLFILWLMWHIVFPFVGACLIFGILIVIVLIYHHPWFTRGGKR
jgi:hypothetical protein